LISTLYAAAARRRRERYASRPDLRRRLRRPVISIGNLAVGGRGKTPVTASVARLLLEMGERPAILSRGYARARPEDGVVVVRDPDGIRADVARSGDEPMMLARQLPGASVLASADRYTAGCLAEHHFGATVHVLDDGFQHLQLDRDVDVVLLGVEDTESAVTLPAGRLREPFDCIVAADAVLTVGEGVHFENWLDLPVFSVKRVPPPPPGDSPAFAIAGIAAPERFFESARRDGWRIAGARAFRDHHCYGRKDLAAIYAAARAAGAGIIVTTEKDFALRDADQIRALRAGAGAPRRVPRLARGLAARRPGSSP
jgi:tetraacyldisaccharide 4'-kinase